MNIPRGASAVILALMLAVNTAGCSKPTAPGPAPASSLAPTTPAKPATPVPPDQFLAQHGLEVEGDPIRFSVKVPASWTVNLGAYPEGLYWGLVNVFSKDAGLDMTPLRGQTVDVVRYSLRGGLPGEGEQAKVSYPSHVIMLVKEQKVVGSWLAFNVMTIGPSVDNRDLQAITGSSFDDWVSKEQYFADAGANADIASLGPTDVLGGYLEAITAGNKARANAFLTPNNLLQALTVNMDWHTRLYNPDFGENNSMTDNIVKGRLLEYQLMDPQTMKDISEVGNRTRIEIAARLDLTWRMGAFNTPGPTTRFAILTKYPGLGWKLDGLGTGP